MPFLYRLSRKTLAMALMALAGSLSSCEKDELTRPAEVYFHFKLDREPSGNESLVFNEGTMDIQSIAFTGDRQSGEDIAFVSDFGTIVRADLATGNTDPVIKFDVPQGTYREISFQVDPDNTVPDLIVTGHYAPVLVGPPIPLQLEMDLSAKLSLVAKASDGGSNVVLSKDGRASVEIFLNPSQWITDIPLLSFQTADLQNINGVPSIVISKQINPQLYSILEGKIAMTAEAIFK